MSSATPPLRILLAPLNWGLGHATRSIALAQALRRAATDLDLPLELHWASDGDAAALLRRERPAEALHPLPGARVRYPTRSMTVNLFLMGPQLAWSIWAEARVLRRLQRHYGFDLILSDNRFGCRVTGIPSWILTHQVHLPLGSDPVHRVGKWLNHVLLRRFDQVLVPDYPPPGGLAGAMSKALGGAITRYLGPLSRFQPESAAVRGGSRADVRRSNIDALPPRCKLAIVLSGPEPARGRLEASLLEALPSLAPGIHTTLVRGLPRGGGRDQREAAAGRPTPGVEIERHDYLGASELREVLATADVILTRSGYTTVMDLDALGRKAIYVPTPGQPEQEVLAEALADARRGWHLAEAALREPGVLAEAIRVACGEGSERSGVSRARRSALPSASLGQAGRAAETRGTLLADWARDTLVTLRTRSVNKL